jgi:malic enzyme
MATEADESSAARLAKAATPATEALKLHPFYRGKVQVLPKCPMRGADDFAIWYSPGVAAPCQAIAADPAEVYAHTGLPPVGDPGSMLVHVAFEALGLGGPGRTLVSDGEVRDRGPRSCCPGGVFRRG